MRRGSPATECISLQPHRPSHCTGKGDVLVCTLSSVTGSLLHRLALAFCLRGAGSEAEPVATQTQLLEKARRIQGGRAPWPWFQYK
jgi:hypothetical protein